jgi:hypothetical protein
MKSKISASGRQDRPEYLKKKAFFDQLITAYGRKPVLEILENPEIEIFGSIWRTPTKIEVSSNKFSI